jgi:two-component system LytT family sensor kinase
MHQALPAAGPDVLIRALRRPISHDALFWILQASGWGMFGLIVLGFMLVQEPLKPAIFDSCLLVVSGFVLTSLYRYLYRRWRRLETPLPVIALGIGVLGVIGVPLWYEPQILLTRLASASHPSWVAWVPNYDDIPAHAWLQWGTVLFGWSFLYFGINDWISLQSERRRAATAELSAQAARLRALQSQLQPHFLFNTLNSVSSLILDNRPATAVSMIAKLGELLRLSLQTSDTPQIPLEEEIAFLNYYLEIEKMRFSDRLQYRFDIAPEARRALVPTLLLQPLVENAVRHGILPLAKGGTVAVIARVEERRLKLRIEDNGKGLGTASEKPPYGFGLANVAQRLQELFGNQAVLVIGRSASGGIAIDIEVPLIAAAAGPARGPSAPSS